MRYYILLFFCFSFGLLLNTAFGQNIDPEQQKTIREIKISGVIEDDNGLPIPGANVLIKGTTIGVVTDIDGRYEITVSDHPYETLVVSYLGYITQEIKVKGQSKINLILQEDLVSLDEVVITGYQQIKSERATGSYGIMTEKSLENQVTANVVKKMEGAMSGVLVNDDNTFEIRGVSTLFGNDQPLIVIDGVPVDTDLSNINPDDIEQITVLKDAASAAIYGVRSSNGVIVVTTKSAIMGEDLKVDFSSFFTIKSKHNLNDYQAASSASIIEAEMEAIQKFNPYSNTNINTYFYGYTKVYDVVDQLEKGLISQEDAVIALSQMRAFDHTQQFKDQFIRNEFEQNYSLSLRGSGKKNKYYFSAGFVNNQSGYVGDKNSRLTLNLKDDFSPAKWIDLGINIYTTFNNRSDNSIETEYMRRKPYEPIVDENGNYVSQYKDWSMRAKDSLENLGYLNWDYNLIKDQQTRDYTTEGLNLRINGYAKFNISDFLSFTTSLYTEFDRSGIVNFNSQDAYYSTDLINRMTITDSSGNLIRQIPLGGISNTTDMRTDSYTFRNQLDFFKNFGKHHVTAIGGVEVREQDYFATNKKRYGVDQQALQYVYINNPAEYFNTLVGFNGQPQLLYSESYFYDNYISELGRDVSYYANAGYRFERRYSVSGSFRLDQSNLFGVDKRLKSNPLWSVGALWNIAEEKFITNDKINRLELKVSYGITGNVKKNLLTFATAEYGTNQYEEIFLNKLSAQNDGVGHEDTKILNIATQFAFFNWLSGSIEYFSKNSSNLLGQTPVDYTSGWLFAWSNYASSKSNGVEFTFNFDAINRQAWNWRIGFNFTWVQTEVTNVNTLFNQATYYAPRYKSFPLEGYPVNSLFGFHSGGVDEEGNGIIINKEGEEFEAKDAANFKVDDLVYLGSVSPTYFGGIYSNLSYKNLTLDFLFTYKGGHVSRMPHPLYIDAYYVSTNTHESLENRWRKPGDENIEGILPSLRPSTSYYYNEDYGMYHTDQRVFEADYLRFRKVSLSYNLNIKGGEKPKSILFYGEVRNLALFTKNKLGIDPDYIDPYTGTLRLTEPMNFILGIRASF